MKNPLCPVCDNITIEIAETQYGFYCPFCGELVHDDRKKTYISGAISKRPNGNKEAFSIAQARIEEMGFIVHNPHEIGAPLPPWSSWVDYMRVCIAALCTADSIFMLRGWRRSRGARVELYIAKKLKLEVVYER